MAKNKPEGYLTAKESRKISKENRRITNQFEKQRKRKNVPESEYLTTMGLVGESGCGKSVTSLSLMQLIQRPQGQIVEGEIRLNLGDGKAYNIAKTPNEKMMKLRGNYVSMIFQEPMTSLNPVFRIGEQVDEVISLHDEEGKSKETIKEKTIELLKMVGIANSEGVYQMYPHELSGGMRQRVMIAMALACSPRIIIADEPTTALDVTIQAQILELIKKLQEQRGTSMILITHDLGVVAQICDDVAIVYAGEIVEKGTLEEIYDHPMHPYTEGLFGAIPELTRDTHRLSPVPGLPPDPTALPTGCYFAPRCPYATDLCTEKHFDLEKVGGSHYVRCRKKEQEG